MSPHATVDTLRSNGLAPDILIRLRAIVGDRHVLDGADEVAIRSRCLIPHPHRPSTFVWPASTQDIQAILALARAHQLTLWPASKGKNWGYGSATGATDGVIMLMLERMNRILSVDPDLAYAVIEPGVTFRQLHQHLRDEGLPLWLDCTDGPADGSVIGNALERGIGETPYGDHFQNICGMEVVLPDGSIVQTGGGAHDASRSWNCYKWGVGPYLEGLFSQSNYGIVTRMGVSLMPRPAAFCSCIFEVSDPAHLPQVIDALRVLQFEGAVVSKVHLVNDLTTLGIVCDNLAAERGEHPTLSDARRAALRRRHGVASWTFAAGIYGTPAQVRAARRLVRTRLGRYGRCQFLSTRSVTFLERILPTLQRWHRAGRYPWLVRAAELVLGKPLASLELLPHVHGIEQGAPSDYFVKHAYMQARLPKPADGDIDPARDGCGGIWTGPVVPMRGEEVRAVVELCERLARAHQLDLNVAIMVANPRAVIVLASIFFDKRDAEVGERAHALYLAICRETQARGYQQYRTSTAFMPEILTPAPAFHALATTIKHALDPHGILAPGKYGIG